MYLICNEIHYTKYVKTITLLKDLPRNFTEISQTLKSQNSTNPRLAIVDRYVQFRDKRKK